MGRRSAQALLTVLGIALGSLALSCCGHGDRPEWGGTISTRDGLRIVRNPIAPVFNDAPVSLVEDLVIGGDEGKDERLLFHIIPGRNSLDVDRSGNIYITDVQAGILFVVDPQGRFVRTIGRSGQGPGEFQSPACLKIVSGDRLAVYDRANRRLSFFTLDGILARELSLATHPALFSPQIDSLGHVFGLALSAEGYDRTLELLKISTDGKTADRIASSTTKLNRDERTIRLFTTRLEFRLSWRDEIVWGAQEEYELNIADNSGRLKAIIQKNDLPVAVTRKDIDAEIDSLFGKGRRPSDRKPVAPATYPPFSTVLIADDGRIFVRVRERSPQGIRFAYDVFDDRGIYVYRMRFPGTPLLIRRNRLYTLEEDEDRDLLIKRFVMR